MSFTSKVQDLGESRQAWFCLFVAAMLVAGGYLYVFVYLISNLDGHNAAWSAAGSLASCGVAWKCRNIYEETPPRVADGPLARRDAEWGPLTPEYRAEIEAAFRNSKKIIK